MNSFEERENNKEENILMEASRREQVEQNVSPCT